MEELWERAVETAIEGQANSLPIKTLTLDGAVKCYNGRLPPPALLEKYQTLEHLSIANVGLTSLENFPRLWNLQRLILSDNRISGGLEFLVQAGLKSLRDLDLSNNRIQSLDDLSPLAQLDLVSLDLYECPVTRIRDYRVRVFGLIKSLKYLDKLDADENDEEEEEEEDDEEDEEDEDDEDGEIDGDDRLRKNSSGSGANGAGVSGAAADGVIDVNEDEESEEGGIEEVGVASNGLLSHNTNGFQVADRNGDVVDDEGDDEEEEESEEVDGEGSDSDEEDVVEVHEVEDSDEDEEGVEDEDGGDLDDDEEEVEDEDEDTGLENTERLTDNGGEIDGHEHGEEDSDGDGEYEEEDGEDEIGTFGLQLLWLIVHFIVSIWYFSRGIVHALESCIISSGFLERYKALDVGKVHYLAIVVDSEDACQTSKIIQLLQWLSASGLKHVCLYDAEGVLKRSKETILERLSNANLSKEADKNDLLLDKTISLEFVSFADGKEAVAKAANLLFAKYYLRGDQEKPVLTESHVTEALKAIGSGGPDPDLLLVYGPARCHLGFPAWRIRYTEIVHMGPLKSMKYGALLKAIHKFTMVRQNYGK